MKEIQKLYNKIVEDVDSASDMILRVNDLYTVILLLVSKSFEVSTNKEKNIVIDSIKPMTNRFIEQLMKVITEEELDTIDEEQEG